MGIGPAEVGETQMTDLSTFREIIEAGEYDHYGLRAHRGVEVVVGQSLGNSRVWIDGECTDEELDGISALEVKADTIDAVIANLAGYAWADEPIVLVAGNSRSWGEDAGEIVIPDNICLAVLA